MFRIIIFLAALVFLWWSINYILLPIVFGKRLLSKSSADKFKDEIKNAKHRKKLAQLKLEAVKADAEATEEEKITEKESEEIYNSLQTKIKND